jgi:L-ascorbate metabolism protein UlaG (beta-lactamase superfamily)
MSAAKVQANVEITYLGQAGFIFSSGSKCVIIDPYLSNYVVDGGIGSAELFSREFPPPVIPTELPKAQLVFLTHDHADHCDPHTVLPLFTNNLHALFVCPKPVADHLKAIGIPTENILTPEILSLQQSQGITFYALPAAHYGFDRDATTGDYAYFGFVIKIGEKWLYHAGDTILYAGLEKNVLAHTTAIDIACLPVNGRDALRESQGMIGNLDAAEALGLAGEIKCEVMIPMHNDLFKSNHMSNAILAELAERKAPMQKIHCLQPSEKYIVP